MTIGNSNSVDIIKIKLLNWNDLSKSDVIFHMIESTCGVCERLNATRIIQLYGIG